MLADSAQDLEGRQDRAQHRHYAGWTREVADAKKTDFIDLNEITARKYDALGEAAVEPLFGDPHTHTTAAGAIMNAESVGGGAEGAAEGSVGERFLREG